MIYHTGYMTWRSSAELAAALLSFGIKDLYDIRQVPYSKRTEFNETPLRATLNDQGIVYHPCSALGNPFRHDQGPVDVVMSRFGEYLQNTAKCRLTLGHIKAVSLQKDICIMCACKDGTKCHRSVVMQAVKRLDSSVQEAGADLSTLYSDHMSRHLTPPTKILKT